MSVLLADAFARHYDLPESVEVWAVRSESVENDRHMTRVLTNPPLGALYGHWYVFAATSHGWCRGATEDTPPAPDEYRPSPASPTFALLQNVQARTPNVFDPADGNVGETVLWPSLAAMASELDPQRFPGWLPSAHAWDLLSLLDTDTYQAEWTLFALTHPDTARQLIRLRGAHVNEGSAAS